MCGIIGLGFNFIDYLFIDMLLKPWMLVFYGHTWWKKLKFLEEITDLGWMTTTLPDDIAFDAFVECQTSLKDQPINEIYSWIDTIYKNLISQSLPLPSDPRKSRICMKDTNL